MTYMETSTPDLYNVIIHGGPNAHTNHWKTSSMAGFESQE